jgi:hypothetical protein
MYTKKITQYFKQSLVDADRLCPEDKALLPVLGIEKSQQSDSKFIALENNIWESGSISRELAKQIIAAKQPKGKPVITEIEAVLFPRVDLLTVRQGQTSTLKRQVLLPLVVFVQLQEDGQLKPGNKSPWIPRVWLAPNQSATEPFGEMRAVDEFFTQNPFDGIETCQQLTVYCLDLLIAATGFEKALTANEPNQSEISLFEIPIHQDYTLSDQCLLQTEPPISGTSANILKVYDYLLEQDVTPKLYEKFCSPNSLNLSPYQDL